MLTVGRLWWGAGLISLIAVAGRLLRARLLSDYFRASPYCCCARTFGNGGNPPGPGCDWSKRCCAA